MDGPRQRASLLAMAAGENKGDRGQTRGVMLQGLAEGGGQFLGAIVVQQEKQLRGKTGGGFSVFEGGLEEGLAFWDANCQTPEAVAPRALRFLSSNA